MTGERKNIVVSMNDVSFSYPNSSKKVLSDIDIAIPEGQCVVITGKSGCGKTTLTRLINGLIPHVYSGELSGEVTVNGTDVSKWTPDELGVRVGSVFQNPRSQFVNLDVASEIAFGCENLGLDHDTIVHRVDEAAHLLAISDLLGNNIEELSGGQKQSVILASAFAMHPDIFVLDEPTASLDVESMKRLASVVKALKDAGKTVIVSEHRLWWLSDVADRVILMRNGTVADDWSTKDYSLLPRQLREDLGMRAWTIDEMEQDLQQAGKEEDPILNIDSISVKYRRGTEVLTGLSLETKPGCILGIIGKNGAGKTTLMRTLAGLTREHEGNIYIENSPARFKDRPKTLHLVMQEPGYQLFASSARDELHTDPQKADSLLDAFDLAEHADRHPLSLSGGERQRLAIAAGVAHGAKILILDEPTSGLDLANMQRVAETLRRVANEGVSVLLVTHDYEFLCAVCDEVAEVSSGRIFAHYPLDHAHIPRLRKQFGL